MASASAQRARTRKSLATTLASALLGLSVTTLLVTGSLEIYLAVRVQRQSIADQQQTIAENTAGKVRAFVLEKHIALETAASIGSLLTAGYDESKVILEKLLGLQPAFRQLQLYDAQRRERVRVSRLSMQVLGTLGQTTERDRAEMFDRVARGQRHSGPVCIDDTTGEPMVVMAVPVRNVFGDVGGVLAAELNLKFMWDMVERLQVGRGGQAYVVDRAGYLIAAKDTARVLRREDVRHLPQVNEFASGNAMSHMSSARAVEGLDGGRVVANRAHLGRPDWAVVTELPVGEAYSHVIQSTLLSVGVVVLAAALAVVIGIYLAKRITRPVAVLSSAARDVGRGNLEARVDIEPGDEIGDLAAAFNQMLVDLATTTVSHDSLAAEVAERRAAEAELRQAKAKLQREIDGKNDFLRVVSHDMGAPLRNIMGMVDSITRRHGGDLPEETKDRLARVRRNAAKEMELIGELLELSRIRTRRGSMEEVDIGEVMRSAAESLTADLEAKAITFLAVDQWPVLTCERARIAQVLQNLIDNAAKYMDPHEGAQIQAGWQENATHYVFHVRDNGPGIALEDRKSLFHVFRRGRGAASKADGKGIGLAAVKAIAETYDGEAWVESEVGEGSTFCFSLAKDSVSQGNRRAVGARETTA